MKPPKAEGKGSDAEPLVPAAVSHFRDAVTSGDVPEQADLPVPQVLRKRADFLKAASARRQGTAGFLVQARFRGDTSPALRIGFTCSKKLGNAVMRNRAKRRLREIARAVLPGLGRSGWDYVLVGRPGATVDRPFGDLLNDLRTALLKVHDAPIRTEGAAPARGKRRGKGTVAPPPKGGVQ